MKNKYKLLILCFFTISGCSDNVRFLVCPSELSITMKKESELGQRRELLVGLNYRVLMVEKGLKDMPIPIQHYRPEHTFGNRVHPLDVSYEKPLTISTIIIIEKPQLPVGIAIKKKNEQSWRVHWLKADYFKDLPMLGVIYLPDYSEIPITQVQ